MSTRSNTKLVWRVGDTGYINGRYLGLDKRIMYRCRVLGSASVSEYYIEITHEPLGLDRKPMKRVWTHDKPIPCSVLRTSQY